MEHLGEYICNTCQIDALEGNNLDLNRVTSKPEYFYVLVTFFNYGIGFLFWDLIGNG